MTIQPKFLRVSEKDQRAGFREITAYCEDHLSQALEPDFGEKKWSVQAALAPKNRVRNRYSNVLPWDKTRVHIPSSKDGSDYINASFVQLKQNRYIAAQGPLRNTVHHFWAMCFSQAQVTNSSAIIIAMVTPLVEQNREKCFQYWPTKEQVSWDMGEVLQASQLTPESLKLTWISEETTKDFVLTTFSLESDGIRKTVYHYYYSGWKDTSVPDSVQPLISLSEKISVARLSNPNLIPIVHCSAGVGRTGTFIAIDHFLNSDLSADAECDYVFETVKTLRDHRMMMVQTMPQFCFLYQVAQSIYNAR